MQEIIDNLQGLGYQGECLQASVVDELLENGVNSAAFRSLITWITNELGVLLDLDEQIHPDSEVTDFALELSSLLKELSCPYSKLIGGSTSDRFKTKPDCLLLLNYLITELMAAKMSQKFNPHKKVVIEVLESPPAIALKSITQNLSLGKPPPNITPKAFFERLLNQFSELYKKNEQQWGKALFTPNRQLTYEEWIKLEKLQADLDTEYDLRRKMLMTRLDVTIQSFQWSDAAKKQADSISECYMCKRQELDQILYRNKRTDLIELLAARNDLLHVEKTSSAKMRKNTQTDLQKHIIGMVPDRGGRANEHQPPPPEMPPWQKNRNQGGGGQGGGGGGGGGGGNWGGNRNYKGQNPQNQRNFQQNYQQQGSNQQGYGNYSGNNYQQGYGDSNYNNSQNNNRGGGNRVQGGWSQSGGNNRGSNDNYRNYDQNQQRGDNYYNSGGGGGNSAGGGSKPRGGGGGGYHGGGGHQQQGQDFNRRGGQSNYNRGGRR